VITIITLIRNLITVLSKFLFNFDCFLVSTFLAKSPAENPVSEQYKKFKIDAMPIIETPRKLDFKVLLASYHQSKGKSLKPVNTRESSTPVASYATCPRCGAPSTYIYDNSGGRGQLLCKVCGKSFNLKNDDAKNIFLRCPHCSKRLEKVKERFAYFIYKCRNNDCPLYVKNLNSMSKESKLLFSKSPGEFRVRYLYRQYRLTLAGLSKFSRSVLGARVDLSKIHFSKHILGLVLTYHINYGLSTC